MGDNVIRAVKNGLRTVRAEAERVGFKWRPTAVVAFAAAALLFPKYHNNLWYWRLIRWLGGEHLEQACFAMAIDVPFVSQLVIPIVLLLLMREKLTDYGLGLGNIRTGLRICGLFYLLYVPCFIALVANDAFREYYAGVAEGTPTVSEFLLKDMIVVFVMTLRTEFFYRGFLLFGVKRSYGAFAGVLVQLIPYVLIHAGKAEIEAFGSLPVGLALGYLAARTGSIWYGAFLHWSIALLLGVAVLVAQAH